MRIDQRSLEPLLLELGKAPYIGQQFEFQLLIIVSLISIKDDTEPTKKFVIEYNKKSELTLGRLTNILKKHITLPENYETLLSSGVETRNFIAHGFLFSNAEMLGTEKERRRLINELIKAQIILDKCLSSTSSILEQLIQHLGGNLETILSKAQETYRRPRPLRRKKIIIA